MIEWLGEIASEGVESQARVGITPAKHPNSNTYYTYTHIIQREIETYVDTYS